MSTYRLELLPTEEGHKYYTKNEDRNNDNAGYDLYVSKNEIISSFKSTLLNLGVKARMLCITTGEEVHYRLVPRSSIYKSGIFQANSEGIIDRTYRGVIMAPVSGLNPNEPVNITEGMRLFQIVAPDLGHIKEIRIVESLPETNRGESGFGSSGLF
jgi:deoxyuridine 5'-triphosphate nucleotidohydrolase